MGVWSWIFGDRHTHRACTHERRNIPPSTESDQWVVAATREDGERWVEHNAVFVKEAEIVRTFVCVECGETATRTDTERVGGEGTVALKSQMGRATKISFRTDDPEHAGILEPDPAPQG